MLKTRVVVVNLSRSELLQDLDHLRQGQECGIDGVGLLELKGADAPQLFQSICALDLSSACAGGVAPFALLDRKGIVRWAGLVLGGEKTWYLVCRVEHCADLLAHVESLVFAEDVQIQAVAQGLSLCPASSWVWDLTGEGSGLVLSSESKQGQKESLQALALQSGLPWPWDSEGLLFNASPLALAYKTQSKCFPGQEIVARLRDRGQSPWECRWAVVDAAWVCQQPEVEQIDRCALDPKQDLVLLKVKHPVLKHWEHLLTTGVQGITAPAYRSSKILAWAEQKCAEGFAAFHQGDWDSAQKSFGEALAKAPYLSEAWEALGATRERQGDLDGAIASQKALVKADPSSVMAHTNLSRLYMRKGWIEQAESEQEKARVLQNLLEKEGDGQKAAATAAKLIEQSEQILAEKKRKEQLFLRALELDPEDDIALFGLGKSHADRQEWDLAWPYLQKLLSVMPSHSAGWAQSARCARHVLSGADAIAWMDQGIEIAKKQGDLMPMRMMETLRCEIAGA